MNELKFHQRFVRRLQRLWRVVWLCGVALLLPSLSWAEGDLHVLLLLSERAAPYQTFANTFKQNLPPNFKLQIIEQADSYVDNPATDVVVTVGVKAAQRAVQTQHPMLAAMLPSTQWQSWLSQRPKAIASSAIYLDQSLQRQAEFLRVALPLRKKIGVLYSFDSTLDVAVLRKILNRHGATLVEQQSSYHADLFEGLHAVLQHSEVLLAMPEASIYNSNSIRNILMESYRQRVPLVGYSQAYVNAGALCAIFSTPEQLAAQASEVVLNFAQTQRLPAAQYPSLFSIAVNDGVAHALGIAIDTPELLRLRLNKLEEQR